MFWCEQVPGTASIEWDDTLQLSPDCVDLTTYSVPAAQLFKEEETTFVANIFVKTITNNAEGYEFEVCALRSLIHTS